MSRIAEAAKKLSWVLTIIASGLAMTATTPRAHASNGFSAFEPKDTPLVAFRLSPTQPKQGDSVTVFIETRTSYDSPDNVVVSLKATLDGSDVTLLHPSSNLWLLSGGPFTAIGKHDLTIETSIEDQRESAEIRRALTSLNQNIARLQDSVANESDPARKTALLADLSLALMQRTQLSASIENLIKLVGADSMSFRVEENATSPDYPHVTTVTPSVVLSGQAAQVTITGNGFTNTTQVLIGGQVTTAQFVDGTKLVATAPQTLPLGLANIEIRVPVAGNQYKNAVRTNALLIAPPGDMPIARPVASSGAPQTIAQLQTVTLDGSQSYDGSGMPLSYHWQLVSQPEGSHLTTTAISQNLTRPTASFTPDVGGTYVLSLVVSNGLFQSLPSLTAVTVKDPGSLVMSPTQATVQAALGQTGTTSFTVSNGSATEPLFLSSLNVTGVSASEVSLAPDRPLPAFLMPGQSVTVSASYTPRSVTDPVGAPLQIVAKAERQNGDQITGEFQLTVIGRQAVLQTIALAPANPTLNIRTTLQLTATGRYSDNSTGDVTAQAVWGTSDPAIAAVNSGLVTGFSIGTAAISGAVGSVIATTQVRVVALPPAISYSPSSFTLTVGVPASISAPANTGGAVTSYSVSPNLPAGLSLNLSTGVISGTPTATISSAQYLVTASNSGGAVSITIQIVVTPASITSAIATGQWHTCAVVNGGAQCWGNNSSGKLGNNSTTESHVPVQVQGLTSGVTAIAGGVLHTCAVVNGGAQCWGDNSSGKLGNNSTTESHVPVQVQGLTSGVTAIAGGELHTCAIVNGGAQCWGWNSYGQLGNNSTTDSYVPVQVTGLTSGVTAIAVGVMSTCAIVNGAAMCWGMNHYGQLGNNSTTDSHVPVQVTGLTSGVTGIAAGYLFNCAIMNGATHCWGTNSNGELGTNSTTESLVPVQALGLTSSVTAIAAGNGHTCAILNNAAQCWGKNDIGQLGNSSTIESHVPVQVSGLTSGVTAIAAGNGHTCAILNNAAQCWGMNYYGELGNNSNIDSLVPVNVHEQSLLQF